MSYLTDFSLNEEHKRLETLGDKLSDIESFVGWYVVSWILLNLIFVQVHDLYGVFSAI